MAAPNITPYVTAQNSARSQFAAESAANTFSRNLSAKRGRRDLGDMQRGFGRALPSFQASFGRRGLAGPGISSGVQQQAMGRFLGDYTRQYSDMQQNITDQSNQFDFNQSRFVADRDRALADIGMQKQALIANTAQHIASIRPYLGG